MSFILTSSNQVISLNDITPDDINIDVIGHALSNLCRFGGHCRPFYSVAQHSIEVSLDVPKELALLGLLHDAAEAYVMDLPTPIKKTMPGYNLMEQVVWKAIALKWDLPLDFPEEIKIADSRALVTEFHHLFDNAPSLIDPPYGVVRKGKFPSPMSPLQAFIAFMRRFNELTE